MGNRAHAKKDYSAAVEHFSEAIELDPSNHVLYSNRSACLAELGRLVDARADGERCVSIDPTFVKGKPPLARESQCAQLRVGPPALGKSMPSPPHDLAGYHRKAHAEFLRGELEAAAATCREGLRRDPRCKALVGLGSKARERHLRASAPAALARALATDDPAEVAPARARARRGLDGAHLAEAEARLRALTRVRPRLAFTAGSG